MIVAQIASIIMPDELLRVENNSTIVNPRDGGPVIHLANDELTVESDLREFGCKVAMIPCADRR